MSKVYGTCKAGCKYPVVTEEDWLKSIPYRKEEQTQYTYPQTGTVVPAYILQMNKLYRISKVNPTLGWGFNIKVDYSVSGNYYTYSIPLPESISKNQRDIRFRMVDVQDAADLGENSIKIIYEINDKLINNLVVYQETIPQTYEYANGSIRVEGDAIVYFIDEDMSVAVEASGSSEGGVDLEEVEILLQSKQYATKTQVNGLITVEDNGDGTVNLVITPLT